VRRLHALLGDFQVHARQIGEFLVGPSRTFQFLLGAGKISADERGPGFIATLSCACQGDLTSSTPPLLGGGGGAESLFFRDVRNGIRAVPLERLGRRAAGYALCHGPTMLAEQHSGVNGCEQRRFGRAGGSGVTGTEAWAENREWSSGRNRGHWRCGSQVTAGAGRLAGSPRMLISVAEFG